MIIDRNYQYWLKSNYSLQYDDNMMRGGDKKKKRHQLGDKNRFGSSTRLSSVSYDPWPIITQLCFEIKYTACDTTGSERSKHEFISGGVSNGISGRHGRKRNQIVVLNPVVKMQVG